MLLPDRRKGYGMPNNDQKVIIELSEHDAFRLLLLIKKEINQADKTWQPYWERQAKNIRQSLERLNTPPTSNYFGDTNK